MKKFLALAFGASLLVPMAARAQSDDQHHDQQWYRDHGYQQQDDRNHDDRKRDDRDQHHRDRDDRGSNNGNGYNNGYNNGNGNRGYNGNGYYNGNNGGAYNITARVRSVHGGAVTLDNGRTVFLKNNTNINGNIQAGERISVQGSSAGDGNINATNINVIGR